MTLSISFIRDISDQKIDDKLTIRMRHTRNDYTVRFTDGLHPNSVWVQSKTYLDTMEHIKRMLNFSSIDAIPYSHVQLTVPGFPLITFNVSDLTQDVVYDILQTIGGHLDHPCDTFTISTPKARN